MKRNIKSRFMHSFLSRFANDNAKLSRSNSSDFFFNFFIKCMQSMTMTLSRRCVYSKLHVI